MTEEVWKQIPGFTYYDVSTHGRVRSWYKNRWGRRKKPRMLKTTPNRNGYPAVNLWAGGQGRTLRVHKLVLTAFVGPCPPRLECCHGDGVPTNNHLSNLRWDTHSANAKDAIAHGTHVSPPLHQGEAQHCAKLTEADVIEIRQLYAAGRVSQHELGPRFGVDHSNISLIVRRKTWAHVSAPEGE